MSLAFKMVIQMYQAWLKRGKNRKNTGRTGDDLDDWTLFVINFLKRTCVFSFKKKNDRVIK